MDIIALKLKIEDAKKFVKDNLESNPENTSTKFTYQLFININRKSIILIRKTYYKQNIIISLKVWLDSFIKW